MGAAIQLETCLERPQLPGKTNHCSTGELTKCSFHTLAQMSRRYLSAPCSIVEMERLFSLVSHFVDEKKKSQQLIMQRSFFSSKRTCLLLFRKKKKTWSIQIALTYDKISFQLFYNSCKLCGTETTECVTDYI